MLKKNQFDVGSVIIIKNKKKSIKLKYITINIRKNKANKKLKKNRDFWCGGLTVKKEHGFLLSMYDLPPKGTLTKNILY